MKTKLFTDLYIISKQGSKEGDPEYKSPEWRWKLVDEQINEFLAQNSVNVTNVEFSSAYEEPNNCIVHSALVLYHGRPSTSGTA